MAVAAIVSNIEGRLTCTGIYILGGIPPFLESASSGCNGCKLQTAH